LVWLESVRAAAEEACLLTANVGAAEQLRSLTRDQLVEPARNADDDGELTTLGRLLEDVLLQAVLPAAVPTDAHHATGALAPGRRRLQLVWSAPGPF
jgi:hypothetical protein